MKLNEIIDPKLDRHHKVDSRFSPVVQRWHDDHTRIIERFMSGEKPEASGSKNGYTVSIMSNGQYVIQKDGVKHPVPSGRHMGFWEEDLKPYVSNEEYDRASYAKKAAWDIQVQLDKYVDHQFWMNYASFWLPKEYEAWYWDQDGKSKSHRATNSYWKKKLEGHVA